MPIVDRPTLYSYFETGDRPTESQFQDLIDSNFNLAENSLAQGWVTRFAEPEEQDDNIIIDTFPIPLGVNAVSNLRFVWPVDPDGLGDVTVSFGLYYYSDIENTDYVVSTFNIYTTFFKHLVINQDITVPGSTDPIIIDELLAVNLPLIHSNIHALVVFVILSDAESETAAPIVSFEFD